MAMTIKGFGINADAASLENSLDSLEQALGSYAVQGFEYAEVSVHGLGAMAGGKLIRERVREIRQILRRFPLGYTVHGPNPLNLMDLENLAWQKQALQESLVFAAAIDSEILVYHSGRYIPEETFHLAGGKIELSHAEREYLLMVEREALLELAEEARRLGVSIALENARPYLDGSPYCYAEQLSLLVQQVAAINHPQVGITLDVGHAYLASRFYRFDFLNAVAGAAPYVRHLHLHDNFGRVSSSLENKQAELMAMGRGDLHLPIGWGEIPAAEIFERLEGYSGVVIHEIRPRYQSWARDALAHSRQLTGRVCP
jgi:sugar phosphate isomerase/epimerase